MRKATWTTVGLVALSMLLCGSNEVLAQTGTATSPGDPVERDATDTRVRGTAPGDARTGPAGGSGATAAGTGGSGTASAGTDASSADLRRTVLQLQADLGRMSQELAQVRSELAELHSVVGVGGSGRAGEQGGAQQGTGTRGNTAQGATDRGTDDRSTVGSGSMPRDTRNAQDPGAAVVNAIYTGTVSSVSARQLVLLDEEGQSFTVALGERTRVLRDGKRITAGQLAKGTRVRATVDLLAGSSQAMEIVALPKAR
jgi:hypothetical protein